MTSEVTIKRTMLMPGPAITLHPRIVRRVCGGWLAVSPPGASLKIGVTAATEAEAGEAFQIAVCRWRELVDSAKKCKLGHSSPI